MQSQPESAQPAENKASPNRDFWIGLGAWLAFNIVGWFIPLATGGSAGWTLILLNICGPLAVAISRKKMALGMLAGLGVAIVLTFLLGLVFGINFFAIIYSGQPWRLE
jgi:hypothetical protein